MKSKNILLMGGAALTLLMSACCNRQVDTLQMGKVDVPQVVPGSYEAFVESVSDKAFFELNSFAITDQAKAILAQQAEWMKNNPTASMLVEGYCDERGTRVYNLALGEKRANAVKKYLVSQGVSADRMSIISYGKEKPFVLGSTEEAWAQNRVSRSVIK